MTDQVRSETARRWRETVVALETGYGYLTPPAAVTEQDDALILLFMCCHPSLTQSSALADATRRGWTEDSGNRQRFPGA